MVINTDAPESDQRPVDDSLGAIIAMVSARCASHSEKAAHLEECYRNEMSKPWSMRNPRHLYFVWQEIRIHRFVIDELMELRSAIKQPPE
jgi:hypothetical protein